MEPQLQNPGTPQHAMSSALHSAASVEVLSYGFDKKPSNAQSSSKANNHNGHGQKGHRSNDVVMDADIFERIPRNMNDAELDIFRTQVCQKKKNSAANGYNRQNECMREGDCPYSHCLSWQRRNPSLFDYQGQMCPQLDMSRKGGEDLGMGKQKGALKVKNSCVLGQRCKYSHTKEEQLYHPHVYKTKLCNGWNSNPSYSRCNKFYCPFAHGEYELRKGNRYRTNNNHRRDDTSNENYRPKLDHRHNSMQPPMQGKQISSMKSEEDPTDFNPSTWGYGGSIHSGHYGGARASPQQPRYPYDGYPARPPQAIFKNDSLEIPGILLHGNSSASANLVPLEADLDEEEGGPTMEQFFPGKSVWLNHSGVSFPGVVDENNPNTVNINFNFSVRVPMSKVIGKLGDEADGVTEPDASFSPSAYFSDVMFQPARTSMLGNMPQLSSIQFSDMHSYDMMNKLGSITSFQPQLQHDMMSVNRYASMNMAPSLHGDRRQFNDIRSIDEYGFHEVPPMHMQSGYRPQMSIDYNFAAVNPHMMLQNMSGGTAAPLLGNVPESHINHPSAVPNPITHESMSQEAEVNGEEINSQPVQSSVDAYGVDCSGNSAIQ